MTKPIASPTNALPPILAAPSADSAAAEREALRRGLIPQIQLTHGLPVTDQAAKLAEAIRAHQVVVVCGETGSGKSTQLPKICLAIGRGVKGMIGHTQPRRLAARALAARIAEELGPASAPHVGFQIRFSARPPADTTLLKLMTDGILLAEIQHDRLLSAYDTLIIDEAHERSLNIDFLLGYLKTLLPRRPDLKIIITSATIDPERFSRHFNEAPIVEVSGRGFPVEIRYQPVDEESSGRDLPQAILDAVYELSHLGRGDILVFLPSERVIRETAEVLERAQLSHTRILPLFGRLGIEDQIRVFQSRPGRKIVLATNVAETSITVPGIHYVIDSGLARISRYNHRNRIQRLPVELVSQASANQRSGRCGRIAPGVCVRLYSETDYLNSALFTDPEITRTPLAGVILRMTHLGLGRIEDFPFIDPPDSRLIRQGYRQLLELNAVNERGLTPLGRKMARLPIDPAIARMILAADRNGSLSEVLIIASGLETQDPRDRPLDKQAQADEKHALFRHPSSDFLTLFNLWQAFNAARAERSQNAMRKWCAEHYLSFRRMREWEDVWRQLVSLCREMGLTISTTPASPAAIHQALLSGLLSNVAAIYDRDWYEGTHQVRLKPFPDSALSKKRSKWLMAAELIQTHVTYARMAARIEPSWVEQAATHLTRQTLYGPWWDSVSGRVYAYARVTLYGLIINPKRRVDLSARDPAQSRAILIMDGLVAGDMGQRYPFLEHNQALIAMLETLECKFRRRDLLVEPEGVFALYDAVLPAEISSRAALDKWLKGASASATKSLFFAHDDLLLQPARDDHLRLFPDQLTLDGRAYALTYHYEPGSDEDGMTLSVPVTDLPLLDASLLSWAVPGVWEEKVVEMIRYLPKPLRRRLVPAPDYARRVVADLKVDPGAFFSAVVASIMGNLVNDRFDPQLWADFVPAPHLQIRVVVVDGRGSFLAAGRDLVALKRRFAMTSPARVEPARTEVWRDDEVNGWCFGTLAEVRETDFNENKISGYPCLVHSGGEFSLALELTRERADQLLYAALLDLVELLLRREARQFGKSREFQTLQMKALGLACAPSLQTDLLRVIFAEAFRASFTPLPRDAEAFALTFRQGQARLQTAFNTYVEVIERMLNAVRELRDGLAGLRTPGEIALRDELEGWMQALLSPHVLLEVSLSQLGQFPRYLQAALKRIEKFRLNPKRDHLRAAEVVGYETLLSRWSEAHPESARSAEAQQVRWLLEEWRVSVFAQELGTVQPVSAKKVNQAIDALCRPVCRF